MNEVDICKAIKLLKPTSEFVLNGTDYSSITWHVLDGNAPTWAEIEVAHQQVQDQESKLAAEIEAKRLAVMKKLEDLGLSEDDLKVIGLG